MLKLRLSGQGIAVHTFNPSTGKAEVVRSHVSSRLIWSGDGSGNIVEKEAEKS